ncbi:Gfo/Idh/MocA family protein [Filimonas effusa]|uniref:Gfo/Idh/MocA family oxidoreductase n=1 Tax=Filimonas effusa TaxID=2508721 RepID=A0A4V1MAF4_9BACT|nr:Gfo/Idh/MocA family oxidoreductase [Filimonas effusa]RXK85686.1 Gfo/Idh/MocA family oxidoreductase [Filimonas effusa]
MVTEQKKLGVAVVGLGKYCREELMPALQQTQSCFLAGIVTGHDDKKQEIQRQYALEEKNCYTYDTFDDIADNPGIDIVYVALPNAMHAEYVIRAAKAGKHVICEKPLARNLNECYNMASAVEEAGVRCSMGYRLHFDPYHQELMRLGQQQVFGAIKEMTLLNSMKITDPAAWRLNKDLAGGGPLMNNGIYCVQAAMYISGQLPVAILAEYLPATDKRSLRGVEEGIRWQMDFDSGMTAACETGFSKNQNLIQVQAETGWFELAPAFEYRGLKGAFSGGLIHFPEVNQQARQMDDFAECIIYNKPSRAPLNMGIRDMKIVEAIYESAESGKRIQLNLSEYAFLPEI